MSNKDPARLAKVELSFLGISAEWNADPTERRAAWSLYVELITRISVQPLGLEQGFDREAISSLYRLFQITREILREAGPDVGATQHSVGGIAIAVLNKRIRPFLSKWHPELSNHEANRPSGISQQDHEQAWPGHDAFREELEQLRCDLASYANALADVAGVTH